MYKVRERVLQENELNGRHEVNYMNRSYMNIMKDSKAMKRNNQHEHHEYGNRHRRGHGHNK
jgi:beta-galactosidase beta subunit